ncbi:MAG: DALR anticodon-binding domain-containing protein, partial [Pseudomonadota bacterium]
QVGPEVTRFVMLTRKNDAPLDFDFDVAMETSKENPVWYVQYAHARVASILRKAAEDGFAISEVDLKSAPMGELTHPEELALLKKVAEWPRLVEGAAQAREPHRIAFYLYDLASAFHARQHAGKMDPEQRFLRKDAQEITKARLAMIRTTSVVIAAGLGILGITPAEDM